MKFIESYRDYFAYVDSLRAIGYRVKPYREGAWARKNYYGKWWVHLILLFATNGLGNVLYLVYAYATQSTSIYVRSTVPLSPDEPVPGIQQRGL